MKFQLGRFITILIGFTGFLSYFLPGLTYPMKIIVPLSLVVIYFFIVFLITQGRLTQAQSENSTLQTQIEEARSKEESLNNRIEKYSEFVNKREIFINHGLPELTRMVIEYDGYVKNTYRGRTHQELRKEVGSVKLRTLDIIQKEKRDFDEQLYYIQSNKDN